MWDWLSSPWMGVAGIVVGVVSTLVVAYLQRKPKTLDFEIIDNLAILSADTDRRVHELQVTYGDTVVAAPRIMTVRVQNTGKRAVRRSDFVRDITFPAPANMRGVAISGCRPHDLVSLDDLSLATPPRNFTIAPELLNPGDYFDVQYLLDGDSKASSLRVSARFADQSRPMRRRTPRTRIPGYPYLFAGYVCGAGLTEAQLAIDGRTPSVAIGSIFGAVGIIGAAVLALRGNRERLQNFRPRGPSAAPPLGQTGEPHRQDE